MTEPLGVVESSGPSESGMPYLDAVYQGKNQWWRYLLGIVIILAFWVGGGFVFAVVASIITIVDGDPTTYLDPKTGMIVGMDPFTGYILLNLGHVAMLIGLVIVVRKIHKRSILSLITPGSRIRWKRVWAGFGLWLVLSALVSLIDYVLHPSTYSISFNPERFLLFVPVILLMTPIQTTTEELIFRGYLLQATGLVTRRNVLIALVTGALFMAPHLSNPEVITGFWTMAVYYFAVGFFLAMVTLHSNGLELALGLHAATCLFNALIANYANSVLETESIFYCSELDPVFNLIAFFVIAAIFYLLLVRRGDTGETTEPQIHGLPGDGVEN